MVGAARCAADASDGRAAISLFRYSISYLTLLFAAVAVDALLRLAGLSARVGRPRLLAASRALGRQPRVEPGGAPLLVAHPGRDHDAIAQQEDEVADRPT